MEPQGFAYDKEQDARYRIPPTGGMNGDGQQQQQQNNFDIQSQLGHMVWEAGSKQVKDTLTSYGRIDLFRPYFDVEPVEVRTRLLRSFIPRPPSQMSASPDLYGPMMVVLTMVALLLFNMKSDGYVVQNGTLMGTSLFACFGSWLILSGLLYLLCFVLGAEIPMLQLASVFGYSMTSHCLVLLLTSIYHPSHDHIYFFVLLLVFCAPSATRMALLVCKHARIPTHRLILAASAIFFHISLIIYLHFGFHVMLEEIDSIIDGNDDAINTIKESIPLSV